MISQIEFYVTETFLSLRRHPGMAFAATVCVAAALFVAGIVGLVILNAEHAVEATMNRVRIDVFFQRETTREEARDAYERIRAMGEVESVEFVPREQAWDKLRKDDPELVEGLRSNPYPDSVIVKAVDVEALPQLTEALEKWPEVHEVADAPEVAGKLASISEVIGRVGLVLGVILTVISLVIIHHTIELTLFARRKEIQIMSLVGATPATVAAPFLLEGIVYGLIGGGMALGGLALLYRSAFSYVKELSGASLLHDSAALANGMIVIVVAGAVLGFIGATASILKYLHRPRSRVTNA